MRVIFNPDWNSAFSSWLGEIKFHPGLKFAIQSVPKMDINKNVLLLY